MNIKALEWRSGWVTDGSQFTAWGVMCIYQVVATGTPQENWKWLARFELEDEILQVDTGSCPYLYLEKEHLEEKRPLFNDLFHTLEEAKARCEAHNQRIVEHAVGWVLPTEEGA